MKKNKGPLFIGPVDSEGNFMSWNPVLNVYESEETGQVFDPSIMEFIEEPEDWYEEETYDNIEDEDWEYQSNNQEDEDFIMQIIMYEEEQRRIEEEQYQREQNFLFAMILMDEGEFD